MERAYNGMGLIMTIAMIMIYTLLVIKYTPYKFFKLNTVYHLLDLVP